MRSAEDTDPKPERLRDVLSGEPEFWSALREAMLWRGWDDLSRSCRCHASGLITKVEELLARHGIEMEQYT